MSPFSTTRYSISIAAQELAVIIFWLVLIIPIPKKVPGIYVKHSHRLVTEVEIDTDNMIGDPRPVISSARSILSDHFDIVGLSSSLAMAESPARIASGNPLAAHPAPSLNSHDRRVQVDDFAPSRRTPTDGKARKPSHSKRKLQIDHISPSSNSAPQEMLDLPLPGSVAPPPAAFKPPKILQLATNQPTTLYVDEAQSIQLILSTKAIPAGIFSGFNGTIINKRVQMGRYLSAKLSSRPETVDIKVDDERVRDTDIFDAVTWTWSIKPTRTGPVTLILEIFNQLSPEKDQPVGQIRVQQLSWDVSARGLTWWKYEVSNLSPIWSIGTGTMTLLGFFGIKESLKRNNEKSPLNGSKAFPPGRRSRRDR